MAENTNYLVMARKWRPQVFEDVLGQEHVTKTLKNAIAQQRIPHALIFSGPRGVGKTSVARIMAKALNCENGPTPTPCNRCVNCQEITAGMAMDVQEIDGASNRGINEIRGLREQINFSPSSSPYRIYIIDEVHMLSREAFNAILKTLEEPPSHAIFIFATTEIHRVPATILSRCQCFNFRRISLKQIAQSLRLIAQAEGISISDQALNWLAEGADGSLRDSQSLFEQAISFAGKTISDDAIEELLGFADRRFLYLLSDAILNRDGSRCLRILEEGYYSGLDMLHFYGLLLKHFRNLLLVKILGSAAGMADITDEESMKLRKQVETVHPADLQRLLDILMAEEEKVKRGYDPRISLEVTLLKMAGREPFLPINEIISRMEDLEKRLSTNDNSTAPRMTEEKEPVEDKGFTHPAPLPNQDDIWKQYLGYLKKRNPLLCSKLEQGRFIGYAQGILTLGFFKNYLFLDDINRKDRLEDLLKISQPFLRDLVKINIEVLEPELPEYDPGHPNTTNGNNRINNLRREALNHPALQKIMDIFTNAEVKEVIIKKPGGN